MKALILAAGLGTRLLPYTRHTPKPLFTLNRRPVLEVAIRRLIDAGCTEIIINTHHLHEQIEQFVRQQSYAVPVFTRHEPEILGTGGAIRNVADFWGAEPLMVFNADIVTNIDLAQLYQIHLENDCAVTMAMHHHERFNNVCVDSGGYVTGFEGAPGTPPPKNGLAFTGIHVLDPVVLDFLPEQGPAHIITAYRKLLETGQRIKAHTVQGHYWQDIGTPESYRSAAFDQMAPLAFKTAFAPSPPTAIQTIPLKGDGSDRQWLRLQMGPKSLIMADHHIRQERGSRQEVDAFVDIGRHLHKIDASVPQIFAFDTFSGLVFLEDLGDVHLQQVVLGQDNELKRELYQRVIKQWAHMAIAGARGFNTGWTYQSTHYDTDLIMEKECRYFLEAFAHGYLGRRLLFADYAGEFRELAQSAVAYGVTGFMHRDLQSRNIMIRNHHPWFIDFQGGRLGPLQYDLAALLIDPYVNLDDDLQDALFRYAITAISRRMEINTTQFEKGYRFCRLTRNLQMLGAFAFLSRVKGKTQFESFIPTAVRTLNRNLSAYKHQFPKLSSLVSAITQSI